MLKYNKGEDEYCVDIIPSFKELEQIAIEAVNSKPKGNLFYVLEPKENEGLYRVTNEGLKPLKSWNNILRNHLDNIFIQEPINLQNND